VPWSSGRCLRDQSETLGAAEAGVAQILQTQITGSQFSLDCRAIPMQQYLLCVGFTQGNAWFKPFQPYV
jgi:hypothetical protein